MPPISESGFVMLDTVDELMFSPLYFCLYLYKQYRAKMRPKCKLLFYIGWWFFMKVEILISG